MIYLLKLTFTLTILLFITGCSFKNPFVPSQGAIPDYEQPCDPIATDPMYRATMRPYTVLGKRYCPTIVKLGDTFQGTASWYGPNFHGKQTSNGEYYNMHNLTAAHKTLPINTMVKVTNLRNNRTTTVRINDRGPFVDTRIIDLSYRAALDIDMVKQGTAPVKLEVLHFDNRANKYAQNQPVQKKVEKITWKKQPTTTQEIQAVSGGDYAVQIASLSFKARAIALKEKCYNGNGRYTPYIKEKNFNNQTIYKVMLKGFHSIEEAKDFINEANYQGAFIVRN